MSVTATVLLDIIDVSGVFCVADSCVLQDTFLWNSMGMHTCFVWFSNSSALLMVDCKDLSLSLYQSYFGSQRGPTFFSIQLVKLKYSNPLAHSKPSYKIILINETNSTPKFS